MLIKNASVVLSLWFTIIVHVCIAQVKIQPSAAKGGTCSGSISVSIAGNAGSYTVSVYKMPEDQLISTEAFQRGSHTFKNLCAGDYRVDVEVVVEGGKPCKLHYSTSIASDCGNITLEGLEEAKHTPTDCQTKDGYLQFHRLAGPMGGNPPYQMNLYGPNGSLVPASAGGWQNLGVGNYELRVKDAQDCEAYFPFTLGSESDAELVAYLESVNVDLPCGGLSNGALELVFVPEGAQYTWSNGATTQRLSNLPAGDYTLTLNNGQCTASRTFELRDEVFPAINVNADVLPVCPGASQGGSIRLQIAGGSEPYQVKWSTGWTGTFLNNLKEGNYTVTITDRCKSTKNETYQINQAEAVEVTEQITRTCPQTDKGSIQLSTSGGTAPYAYKWSTGATGNSLTELKAGSYFVTVTDKGQCRVFKNYEVNASDLNLEITKVVGCEGNNCTNAKVEINAKGGIAPYGYLWTGPNNFRSHNQNLTGIPEPGIYTIVVTDAELCTYSKEVNVPGCNNGEGISVSPLILHAGGQTPKGAIFLDVSPQTVDYVYSWTGPNGFTSDKEDIDPANGPGLYTLSIDGPCPNHDYQRTYEIESCDLNLQVLQVNHHCSKQGYAYAQVLLSNVNPNDNYKAFIVGGRGEVTEIGSNDTQIGYLLERLWEGTIKFVVQNTRTNCNGAVDITILATGVNAFTRKVAVAGGYDIGTGLRKYTHCVRATFCQDKVVNAENPEPYDVFLVETLPGRCQGYGGCSGQPSDFYDGKIVDLGFTISNGDCYKGKICTSVYRSGFDQYGYSTLLNAQKISKATTKIEVIDGQCVEQIYCEDYNPITPLSSKSIGRATVISDACGLRYPEIGKKVCVTVIKCDGQQHSVKENPNGDPSYCCSPQAFRDTVVTQTLSSIIDNSLQGSYHPTIGVNVNPKINSNEVLTYDKHLQLKTKSNEELLLGKELNQQNLIPNSSVLKLEYVVVFPNPSNGQFKVLLPEYLDSENQLYMLSVYTLQGRLIHQLTTTNHEVTLDLPNLPQGAYFLKVSSKQGELWVKKLIKIP